MDNGLSASDVALMSRNDGFGFGGDSFVWIFGLLILMGMFNGGFGNNGYDRYATQSDVQYTSQFGQLLDGNRDIMMQANNNTNNIVGAVNAAEYEGIAAMKDAQLQIQDRLAGINYGLGQLASTQMQCHGDTKLLIQEVATRNDAVTVAQTQKILDAIAGNRMAEMQNQINKLELDKAMANVIKFPSAYTYAGGFFPPFLPPLVPPVSSTTTGGTTTTG